MNNEKEKAMAQHFLKYGSVYAPQSTWDEFDFMSGFDAGVKAERERMLGEFKRLQRELGFDVTYVMYDLFPSEEGGEE